MLQQILAVGMLSVALLLAGCAPQSPTARKSTAPLVHRVTITNVLNPTPVSGRDAMNATLVFNRAVPNGEATMEVRLVDGRTVRLDLYPVSKDAQGNRVDLGKPTTRLEIQWSPLKDKISPQQLLRGKAKIVIH